MFINANELEPKFPNLFSTGNNKKYFNFLMLDLNKKS